MTHSKSMFCSDFNIFCNEKPDKTSVFSWPISSQLTLLAWTSLHLLFAEENSLCSPLGLGLEFPLSDNHYLNLSLLSFHACALKAS